jgi:hypothetical protein
MNWKKALGFGALIWVIMFVVISVFVAYGAVSGNLSMTFGVAATVISLVVAYFAARNLAPKNYSFALGYGLIFAVVGIILDFLISQKFAPDIFSSVPYWLNYVLLVLVPILAVKKVPAQVVESAQVQPQQPLQSPQVSQTP